MRTIVFIIVCVVLTGHFQAEAACEANTPADLTGDCKVDFNDFALMADDWEKPAVPHEWVARYNGPENDYDIAYAMAIDNNDNVYVTGISGVSEDDTDYTTVKYDPDGSEHWAARYGGPANRYDRPHAIAIDSNDNIYVTGLSRRSFTDIDYATIKYSPDGNELWVATYDGPDNLDDVASAIAVDSSDNIYVTGYSGGSGTGVDYATIKYSPDSNEPVWIARYDGPANDSDRAIAIAVDSNDDVYVTGYSRRSGISIRYDYATIKYSPDSNQPLWVARYEGSVNSSNIAVSIAIDSSDNVYVTGTSSLSLDQRDYATVKYSPDGNELWAETYNGPGNGADFAQAIAIDSSDNIYVTGYGKILGPDTDSDYITVKYSPDGNEIWVATYDERGHPSDFNYCHDLARAIAIDSSDNIYVTGYSSNFTTSNDYATVKYSPDNSEPIWVARYDGPSNSRDIGLKIAIDGNDNIYVTGYSFDSTTKDDYATIKYSPEYSCTPEITGDFDHDCDVDIYDLRTFCQHWLECNLDPPEACWD